MEPFCPQCRGEDFEIQPDAPLILEEIEFMITNEGTTEPADLQPQ